MDRKGPSGDANSHQELTEDFFLSEWHLQRRETLSISHDLSSSNFNNLKMYLLTVNSISFSDKNTFWCWIYLFYCLFYKYSQHCYFPFSWIDNLYTKKQEHTMIAEYCRRRLWTESASEKGVERMTIGQNTLNKQLFLFHCLTSRDWFYFCIWRQTVLSSFAWIGVCVERKTGSCIQDWRCPYKRWQLFVTRTPK